jgi:hypothetical protein
MPTVQLAAGQTPAPAREPPLSIHSTLRSGERCLVMPAERTPDQLAAMEARIAQTARAIARCADSGDWPLSTPDGWWCGPGQCVHWRECPGGGASG